ncbi:MAG: magnesium/cobalt transporter CorA [Candidatus Dormibacteraeota bacterium]|nr:magnesium/cobalt transporter CorA [Candidatus Dormibacteraeota bacterium]MBO0745346.1 magnesium/cobalt transporter CorA [Candidatus Dormibacteraeota bacterium]
MIVDCALYREGRRVPGTEDPKAAWRRRAESEDESYIWIGLYDPSADELNAVTATFEVHELAIEDLVTAHQRPKLEIYDQNLLMVLKPAVYCEAPEAIQLSEIQVLTGPGYIVTVRHHRDHDVLPDVRRGLERAPAQLRLGPFAALHAIVDRIVDDYGPVIDEVERDIREVETQVFSDTRDNPTERIYRLKGGVVAFQQATMPLLEPLDHLARHRYAGVPDDLTEYFRDVHDHLVRVVERMIGDRELLTSVLTANLAQISTRQNEDMRKISAWVGILAVPTAVAGIYGMNFHNMPELSWPFGYPYALGLMLLLCAGMFFLFKRSGWI